MLPQQGRRRLTPLQEKAVADLPFKVPPLDPHVHEKADVDYPIPSPRDPSASGDDASRLNQGQEGEVRRGGREEARESYLDTPK